MLEVISGALTRRALLLGGTATLAGAGIVAGSKDPLRLDPGTAQAGHIDPDVASGIVTGAALLGDIIVAIHSPAAMNIPMQTNGFVLRLDSDGALPPIDLSKIFVDVTDLGHDSDGNQVRYPRTIGVQEFLRGPYAENTFISGDPTKTYLVLADRVFREDSQWFSDVVAIRCLAGWLSGRPTLDIPGGSVAREDSLAYLPFPVRTPTIPFQRATADGALPLEVTGLHDFARNNEVFARVEAWASIGGMDGPVASAVKMGRSIETPLALTPSGIPAPVYTVLVTCAGLPDGDGRLSFKVYPWVGPPWASREKGCDWPTLNTPKGLPFTLDSDGSYLPVYGAVSQDGTGAAGNDLRGLSFSVGGSIASGVVYRDEASVAAAVRVFNASATDQTIADGPSHRPRPHDDIASGSAVLIESLAGGLGQNAGCHTIRTPFADPIAYPVGSTCFEIRSPSGLPSDQVRLRGVLWSGVNVQATAKAITARHVLRGITLDGVGITSLAHMILDGTAAGAPTVRPTLSNAVCSISIDCRIRENPSAGATNPARKRVGYQWDVRLDHDGATGAAALGTTPTANAGLVASIGSRYTRAIISSAVLQPSCLLGVAIINVPIFDQALGIQESLLGQLLLNVRLDYTAKFGSPILSLIRTRPVVGGLGIGNVFARGAVDSGGPLIAVGADGSRVEADNVIIRHLGHDLPTTAAANNGRVNLLYQDQGFTRINKIGSIRFCAFDSYNMKGDNFPAPEIISAANTSTEKSWVPTGFYYKGAIVWDTAGSPTATSRFYQALRDVTALSGSAVGLSESSTWLDCGLIFGKAFGAQPLRQGNAALRYHVGCRGNVAASTYNSAVIPGNLSGYGFRWSPDELVKAAANDFYTDPIGNDYRPKTKASGQTVDSPLLNRVGVGEACLPFDLAGAARLNDGSGAAGSYERGDMTVLPSGSADTL